MALKFQYLQPFKVFKDAYAPQEIRHLERVKTKIMEEIRQARENGVGDTELAMDLIDKLARVHYLGAMIDRACNEMIITGQVTMQYK